MRKHFRPLHSVLVFSVLLILFFPPFGTGWFLTSPFSPGLEGSCFAEIERSDAGLLTENRFLDVAPGDMAGLPVGSRETAKDELFVYYFPYCLFSGDYWTGVALRNVNAFSSASVTLTTYESTGAVFSTDSRKIRARGQAAFMVGTGDKGEGWMKVTSSQPLTGLAFVSEADGGFMYDMTLVSETARTLQVPHVAQDDTWDTIVYVCNPSGLRTTFTLTYVKSDGTALTSRQHVLPPRGSGTYPLSVLLNGTSCSSGSLEIRAYPGLNTVSSSKLAAFALYHNLKTGASSCAGVSAVIPETIERFTNSVGMEFVRIPAGTFMMGSPSDESQRYPDEIRHRVTLTESFYMQATEVTQGQWKAIMGNNPSGFNECGDACPVEGVSWDDCQSFISKLNQREGTTAYRLPTEAEWEYACRAGTTTPFNTGSCLSTSQANYSGAPYTGCSPGTYRGKTVPVKSFLPNAWGFYGMHGNVEEWCRDWYGSYPLSSITDPTGPSSGYSRVVRGGFWFSSAGNCRSADRAMRHPGTRLAFHGFRVVRDF